MDHNEEIKKLKEQLEELRWKECDIEKAIRELQKTNCQYIIGRFTVGDYNYWDDYYVRLGYIPEAMAQEWADKINETGEFKGDECFDARYEIVTKEMYSKYLKWDRLSKLASCAECCEDYIGKNIIKTIKDMEYIAGKDVGVVSCSSHMFGDYDLRYENHE